MWWGGSSQFPRPLYLGQLMPANAPMQWIQDSSTHEKMAKVIESKRKLPFPPDDGKLQAKVQAALL